MLNMWLKALVFALDTFSYHPKIVETKFRHDEDRDTTINFIIFHYDEGDSKKSSFAWLKRKKNSYNYYIEKNGTITKMVDPMWAAGHAGLSYYDGYTKLNKYSIGICFRNNGNEEYTDVQYKSAAWLVNVIYNRFPDAINRPLLGHSDIAVPRGRKHDPGPFFNWDKLNTYIKEININYKGVQKNERNTRNRKSGKSKSKR